MLRSSLLVLLALPFLVAPIAAQDGNVAIAVFMTIDVKDTQKFERSLGDHAQWHARQNDPWTWAAYQAVGGGTEYAVVSPDHLWSDFDAPTISMAADQAEFAKSDAAALLTGEEMWIWEYLPEFGNPGANRLPILQVTEFEVQGNEEAMLLAMAKFKLAAGDSGTFEWARTVSSDGPPTYFVIVSFADFAALGAPGPTPAEIMRAAYGATETQQIMEGFSAVATITSNRIWTLRRDLSHIPN